MRIPPLHVLVLVLLPLALYAQTTELVYLSGTGPHDTKAWDFRLDQGRNSGVWTTIPVPSQWELQGFGTYEYGHVNYKQKVNEAGHYKTRFTVPSTWTNKTVRLVFGGVMTDTEALINGRPVGPKHQGGFNEFKYDISPLLKYGQENTLAVIVHKKSANESVERAERSADYWTFGGIYRPVWLEILPQAFIDWLSIDAQADGQFMAEVHLANVTRAGQLEATLFTKGKNQPLQTVSVPVKQGQAKARLTTRLKGPQLWTAETPHLYEARFTLFAGETAGHRVTETCGFRSFEIRRGQGFYLNGQRIMLKGPNRHCFHADTGRSLSPAMSRRDIQLMQDMNMNAVRCSHYTPDRHFLDLCDEMGMYVIDELCTWQKPPYDTEVGSKLVRELVIRDTSHPCILLWANGNEGGWNTELDDDFALYDLQNRPVIHPWESMSGINTVHYLDYRRHCQVLAGEAIKHGNRKLVPGDIYLPTEFLHGLHDGGHGAGLDDYWRAMCVSPLGGGGFLWALKDESVKRTDLNGALDSSGIAAPDGIIGPRAEQKKPSYYTIKEIWSPVYIERDAINPRQEDFDGTVPVENRYAFTNLNQCSFTQQLVRLSRPGQTGVPPLVQQQPLLAPTVAPGRKGQLTLKLPADWRHYDVMHLTAADPQGRELFTWTWPLQSPGEKINVIYPQPTPRYTTTTDNQTVTITGGNLSYQFSTSTGALLEVHLGDKAISWGQGPLFTSRTDSETNNPSSNSASVTWDSDHAEPIIQAQNTQGLDRFQWTLLRDGTLQLDYQYTLPEDNYAYAGISFAHPEGQMQAMQWLGDGPYPVYKNRRKGSKFGVHNLQYNDVQPGRTYDWPSFKGYFANLYWVQFFTQEARIEIQTDQEDLFFRTYSPTHDMQPLVHGQNPKGNKGAKAPYPSLDISFLQAIPAIGTKFKAASSFGPQSQLSPMAGTYTGRLYFRFE